MLNVYVERKLYSIVKTDLEKRYQFVQINQAMITLQRINWGSLMDLFQFIFDLASHH